MGKVYTGKEEVVLELGDFSIFTLNRENEMNPQARVHMAFVRYNGMIPQGSSSVMAFEIGEYDGDKPDQTGHLYFLPANERSINCRVNTRGHRVALEILAASPLKIQAKDLIERQTAIRD